MVNKEGWMRENNVTGQGDAIDPAARTRLANYSSSIQDNPGPNRRVRLLPIEGRYSGTDPTQGRLTV
jgi:hypothetical protein